MTSDLILFGCSALSSGSCGNGSHHGPTKSALWTNTIGRLTNDQEPHHRVKKAVVVTWHSVRLTYSKPKHVAPRAATSGGHGYHPQYNARPARWTRES
ncbi:hypothetical protein BO82DRAFT_358130 [Aspergillus uvarum CBS 121591]|uniref:Uncharacterized protein n=1 Tax=Aspergillus uvarum CBS 121591 TaxID=1448315 RepID=A0A319BY14_9EURO|nr:hypothetical protein BO82DRAFT_358130 [Aspergillus uvarum CBS 121591]PYH77624.1 hypothetical protein BO82DRAFT_358130 [Aspergillus uvarum CBS 121591]